jgi:GNAT superfamily N-acetyltransferase
MVDVTRGRIAERAEEGTVASLAGMLGPELVESLGVATAAIGGGTAFRMAAINEFPMFNRVIGLGLDEPLTDDVVDEAAEFARGAGGPWLLLQLPPYVETPEVLELLDRRGFRRGGCWVKMMRPVGEPPVARTDLRIAEVPAEEADELGRVQCVGMEMPPFLAAWCARQVTEPGWRAYAAYDGDRMVAMGSLFRHGDVGQLSGAATLPEARGRGAQSALMARRIADARDLGLAWVTAETGAETPENPNPSLHNMHRAGLEHLYDRQNWLLDL